MLTTLPVWAPYAMWAAHAVLEYWLGRTDKVASGSVIEVVLSTVNSLLPKGKDPNEK